jgi:integral membrane sensor domain MASE1
MVFRDFLRQDSSALELNSSRRDLLRQFFSSSNLLICAVVAVSYFVTGKFGQMLAIPNPSATAFWPPAGIALAAVFLAGNRVWPAIFLGSFLVNLTTTGSIPTSLGLALANTLEPLAAAHLVRKYANGVDAFYDPRDVLRYVLLAGLIPASLCATMGVSLLCQGGFASWSQFWTVWSVWGGGDLLGALLVAPFLVLLFRHRHPSLDIVELLEATVLLVGLIIVCILNFGPPLAAWVPRAGLLYLCLPFVVWAALRFCPLEASGATLIMSGLAMWGTLHGYGPYANTTSAPIFVVGYVAVASITIMIIAAEGAKKRKAAEEALTMYYFLKERTDSEIRLLEATIESLRVKGPEPKLQPRQIV